MFYFISAPLSLSPFCPTSSPPCLFPASKCLSKAALPNVATPYEPLIQSGPWQPCRELFRAGAAYDLHTCTVAFPIYRPCNWCRLCCWMRRTTGYSTMLSLGTSPLNVELVSPMHLFCKSLFFSFLEGRQWNYRHLYRRGGQWSNQPVAYRSSSWAHPSHYHSFISHSPTCDSTLLLFYSPSYLTFWLVHRNFLSKFLSSCTFSLSSNSVDDIFQSSSLHLTPSPLPSFLHIKIINSHSCFHSPWLMNSISPPCRRRLLRIVLRFFGYCSRTELFTATTFSGIALQPMSGWTSHWLFLALSTLSLLRQAK